MTTPRRLDPADRRAAILAAAVKLAESRSYYALTRDDVAHAAGVSAGLVTRYFLAMPELRRQVMAEAVRLEIPAIVAQGIANRCPVALAAPGPLKLRAAMLMAG